jgi:cysteine desulfurase
MQKSKRIYLDYAATTPVLPDIADFAKKVMLEEFGNPSSLHEEGRKAKACKEKAREIIAKAIGAEKDEIFFTSGGTEADHLALLGIARALKSKGNHIITSAIEHSAVLGACEILKEEGFRTTYLQPTKEGLIEPEALEKAIQKETILISMMMANNEIGTIQPIQELAQIAKSKGIFFHTDAVQAFPHIKLDVNALSVDALSISAHKIYAPKGAGALYLRKGTPFLPPIRGGEQERKMRPGTENIPGIAAFGKAVEILEKERKSDSAKSLMLRNSLEDGLFKALDDLILNGHKEKRIPNNLNITFRHADGESLLMYLDLNGIACSMGSACSAGAVEPSHVLLAIGRTPFEAKSSIRFTFGKFSEKSDVEQVLNILPPFVKQLRSASATGRFA